MLATGSRLRSAATRPVAVLAVVAAVLAWYRLREVGGVDTTLVFDEIGYLGNARHLAGGFPDVVMTGIFYSGGSSLPLVPVLWLTDDPTLAKQLGVWLNVGLVTALPFLLYALLRTRFAASSTAALVGAVVGAALPAVTANVATLWAETLLTVLVAAWLLLAGSLRPGARWTGPVAFGALSVALYAVHGRAMVLMVLGIVALVATAATGRTRRSAAIAGLGAAAVVLLATRALNGALSDALYLGGAGETGTALLARVRWEDLGSYVETAFGQLWYLSVASFGLIVAGTWVAGSVAWAGRRTVVRRPEDVADDAPRRPDELVAALLLASTAGTFVLSVVQIGTGVGRLSRGVVDTVRADLLVYGRYNEAVALALIALGAAWAVDRSSTQVRVAVGVGALVVLVSSAVVLRTAFPAGWFGAFFNPSSSTSAFAWITWLGSFSPLRITALVSVVALPLLLGPRRLRHGALVVVVGLLLAQGAQVAHRYVRPFAANARTINSVPLALNELEEVHEVAVLPPHDGTAFFTYQFWLRRAEYRLVEGDPAGWSDLRATIGPLDWPDAARVGALPIASDPSLGTALWLIPATPDAPAGG